MIRPPRKGADNARQPDFPVSAMDTDFDKFGAEGVFYHVALLAADHFHLTFVEVRNGLSRSRIRAKLSVLLDDARPDMPEHILQLLGAVGGNQLAVLQKDQSRVSPSERAFIRCHGGLYQFLADLFARFHDG
jgi:hypothetical protein